MDRVELKFGGLEGPALLPAGPVKALILLLHGYGANGEDLFGLAQPLVQGLDGVAVWSPNAPQSLPGMSGAFAPMQAYQWFALSDLNPQELSQGVQAARPVLLAAIDGALEHFALAHDQLVVVGFSQGGMMAIEAGLRLPQPVAGVVGLSTIQRDPSREHEITARPPFVLVHGDADPVVPPQALEFTSNLLRQWEVEVEATMLPGLAHGIDERAFAIAKRAVDGWLGEG